MKKLIIAALMLSSLSSYAQKQQLVTLSAEVDVGGCFNSKIINEQPDGDEWELRIIPLDASGKEITAKMQVTRIDAGVNCLQGDTARNYNNEMNNLLGPNLLTSVQIAPTQLFKVQLRELDWGFQYVLGGGHEVYELGIYTANMIPAGVAGLVKGPATQPKTKDCLKIRKY